MVLLNLDLYLASFVHFNYTSYFAFLKCYFDNRYCFAKCFHIDYYLFNQQTVELYIPFF